MCVPNNNINWGNYSYWPTCHFCWANLHSGTSSTTLLVLPLILLIIFNSLIYVNKHLTWAYRLNGNATCVHHTSQLLKHYDIFPGNSFCHMHQNTTQIFMSMPKVFLSDVLDYGKMRVEYSCFPFWIMSFHINQATFDAIVDCFSLLHCVLHIIRNSYCVLLYLSWNEVLLSICQGVWFTWLKTLLQHYLITAELNINNLFYMDTMLTIWLVWVH